MITHALIAAVLCHQPNDQQPGEQFRVRQVASIPTEPDANPESALAFDGIDDFATVPACDAVRYPGTGGWTVEFWVKPIIYPHAGEASIIGQESVGIPGRDPWSVRAQATHFEFRIDGVDGAEDRILFDLALGVWQHVACVYYGPQTKGGLSMAVYVDGRQIAQQPTNVVMQGRDDPVYFGTITGTYFRGLLDETRIWSYPLGPNAIARAMQGRVKPNDEHLRAWWTFDDSSAGVAVDRGPNGAHAVLGRPDRPIDPARPTRVTRTRPDQL